MRGDDQSDVHVVLCVRLSRCIDEEMCVDDQSDVHVVLCVQLSR